MHASGVHVKLVVFQTCPAEVANTQAQQPHLVQLPPPTPAAAVCCWSRGMTSLGCGLIGVTFV